MERNAHRDTQALLSGALDKQRETAGPQYRPSSANSNRKSRSSGRFRVRHSRRSIEILPQN